MLYIIYTGMSVVLLHTMLCTILCICHKLYHNYGKECKVCEENCSRTHKKSQVFNYVLLLYIMKAPIILYINKFIIQHFCFKIHYGKITLF